MRILKKSTGIIVWPCAASLVLITTLGSASAAPDSINPPIGRTPTIWIGPKPLTPDEVGIGKAIPNLELQNVEGEKHPLYGYEKSKGMVIVVRDPDCPVSKRYGPRISSMAKHYRDAGFGFVFIYPSETLSAQQRIKDRENLGVPGLYVGKGSFALAEKLGVKSTGEVFILDKEHRLRYRGAIDDQYGLGYTKDTPTRNYLRNALDAVASGRPISTPATSAPGCYIDADPTKDRLFQPLPAGQMLS